MKSGSLLVNFCDWAYKFLILNFLWVGFTLLGGILFGIMPSTIATFHILRKFVQGDLDIPLFKTYKDVYFKEFKNANICGLFFAGVFLFLAFDLNILFKIEATYSTILYILVMSVLFYVTIAFIYFFPTYVHFELNLKDYIKNSFILSLISPIQTFIVIIAFGALFTLVKFMPGLIPFFFVVVPCYLIMKVLYKRFLILRKREMV